MKALFPIALFAASLAATASFGQPGTNQPSRRMSLPPGVRVLKDLEYGRGSDRALRLDLYLPQDIGKPLPLIVWIHGGAWMAGSKDNPSPALPFTAEGYAVAQVGYRFSQEAKFPLRFAIAKARCVG